MSVWKILTRQTLHPTKKWNKDNFNSWGWLNMKARTTCGQMRQPEQERVQNTDTTRTNGHQRQFKMRSKSRHQNKEYRDASASWRPWSVVQRQPDHDQEFRDSNYDQYIQRVWPRSGVQREENETTIRRTEIQTMIRSTERRESNHDQEYREKRIKPRSGVQRFKPLSGVQSEENQSMIRRVQREENQTTIRSTERVAVVPVPYIIL